MGAPAGGEWDGYKTISGTEAGRADSGVEFVGLGFQGFAPHSVRRLFNRLRTRNPPAEGQKRLAYPQLRQQGRKNSSTENRLASFSRAIRACSTQERPWALIFSQCVLFNVSCSSYFAQYVCSIRHRPQRIRCALFHKPPEPDIIHQPQHQKHRKRIRTAGTHQWQRNPGYGHSPYHHSDVD